ncbi:MAG: hypothetical protein U1D35_00580, partial [Paracoccaceae bacterium]|nr:hypothetical protein [Paracoccaceae bacterium]
MRSLLLASLAFAALVSGAEAQTVIRVGHIQPSDHSIGIAVDEFARLVGERTKGAVVVEVHPNGELGSSSQLAEGIRLGTVDVIITGTPYWSNFEPMLNV